MGRSIDRVARTSVIERSVQIAAPVEDVFAFHLDTRNAAAISPRGTRISDVTGRFPAMPGEVVTMRMRQWPSPVGTTWRVRIEAVEPPHRIVDVAERSPFRHWRHEHLFRSSGPGRTLMTDRVAYGLPLGPLGRLADLLVVRRRLTYAFAERHRRTRELLEARAREGAGPA
jgi:ligand-binding SRPBCC domain-containing protein